MITEVTIKEVQNLFTVKISDSKASRMINLVRDAIDKPKPKVLTMEEFCTYYGIPKP